MTLMVDLNCDIGESFGPWQLGCDGEIVAHVTSANIACGFHAGDPATMRKTVLLALEHKVAIGAHPGLPDLVGFGRRAMKISTQEARDMVTYQVGALAAFVMAEGGKMQHVKPHGALYNMASKDAVLASAIAEAVCRINPELLLFAQSGSELIKAGNALGLRTISEVFGDRTYEADGSLTPREHTDSLVKDPAAALQQVLGMIRSNNVVSRQGTEVIVDAQTICIHGDGAHALDFARTIRANLENAGVVIRSFENRIE
jgi:UPF0271 protein